MNVCPNCGNAILGHPKECATCKFDLEKFELLPVEEKNKFIEEKLKEKQEENNIENTVIYVKKECPFEKEFKEIDSYAIAIGICSISIGALAGIMFGSFGAIFGTILGVIGLIISINASKTYSHETDTGFILCLIGTIVSGSLFLGFTLLGLYDGYSYLGCSAIAYHNIDRTLSSCNCPG